MEERKHVFKLYKPIGWTPLETIEELRKKRADLSNEKMSYAGRLDPMAEGLVLILAGENLKHQDWYRKLPKEYLVDIVLGISSDSGDILGILENHKVPKIDEKKAERVVEKLKGKNKLLLPAYSSYRVKGRPLFWWAKEGRLREIEIPRRDMEVYEARLFKVYTTSSRHLAENSIEKINLVKGDFRQEEIKEEWLRIGEEDNNYPVMRMKIECSSGTYIRSLATLLANEFKTGALLKSLKRTKIGDFQI